VTKLSISMIYELYFFGKEIFLLKKQIKNIYTENVHLNANIWNSFLFKKGQQKMKLVRLKSECPAMNLLYETIFLFKCDTLFYTQITYFGKIRSQFLEC